MSPQRIGVAYVNIMPNHGAIYALKRAIQHENDRAAREAMRRASFRHFHWPHRVIGAKKQLIHNGGKP